MQQVLRRAISARPIANTSTTVTPTTTSDCPVTWMPAKSKRGSENAE